MVVPFTFLTFAMLVTWSFYATSSLRRLNFNQNAFALHCIALRKESRVNAPWLQDEA